MLVFFGSAFGLDLKKFKKYMNATSSTGSSSSRGALHKEKFSNRIVTKEFLEISSLSSQLLSYGFSLSAISILFSKSFYIFWFDIFLERRAGRYQNIYISYEKNYKH